MLEHWYLKVNVARALNQLRPWKHRASSATRQYPSHRPSTAESCAICVGCTGASAHLSCLVNCWFLQPGTRYREPGPWKRTDLRMTGREILVGTCRPMLRLTNMTCMFTFQDRNMKRPAAGQILSFARFSLSVKTPRR